MAYLNLPIPGTDIRITDNSQILEKNPIVNNGPIFLVASAADKGPENIQLYNDLDTFRKVHLNDGVVNYNKYGLPLYMADEILASGSSLYFKRIVADDATLSNLAIIAVVNKVEEQKTNAEGQPLYLTPSGEETTESTTTIPNPDYKPIILTASGAITGTTNSEVNSTVTISVKNDVFQNIAVNSGDNINSWFVAKDSEKSVNISELEFKVTTAPSGDNTSFVVTISGTPTANIEGAVICTVPAEKLKRNKSTSVDINISVNESGGTLLKKAKNSTSTIIPKDINIDDEFITIENTPIMISKANIQYGAKYVQNCKDIKDVEHVMDTIYKGPDQVEEAKIQKLSYDELEDLPDAELPDTSLNPDFPDLVIDENSYILPLFIISEKGRGLSNRRIRIVPDYPNSKNSAYFRYRLEIIESGKLIYKTFFSFDPDYVDNVVNRNIETQTQNNLYLNVKILNRYNDEFFKIIEEFSGLSKAKINAEICITEGKDKSGKPLPTLEVGGVNLQHTFGIKLSGGDYGSFGNSSNSIVKNQDYIDLLELFYKGDSDEDVWKRDELFFNIIPDADFDHKVKRAIEYLCKTREDVSCLMDMGTTITEFSDYSIDAQRYEKHFTNSIYYQYGEIVNKFNNRKIITTLPMLICKRLKQHFINGRSKPMAGKSYGFSFPELLNVNHTPKETPKINEKEILRDSRINFGSIQSNVFTLETNYTNQEAHTQLSYSSNVLAIQHLIQDIRKAAPTVRYRPLSYDDLEIQKDKYDTVCKRHASSFEMCKFEYVGDDDSELAKTFKGQIIIVCKDFTMREEFDIFVVHRDDANNYSISSTISIV